MNRVLRTLLIVDDSPEDRELYRRYLQHDRNYAYTILEASSGQQGLELWHQHQPDAIVLEYRLPDWDGLEFLAQLQLSTQQPWLPVLIVTGQGNEAIAVQAMKAGAQDYLVKGQMTAEALQVAVNGAIETVQLRTQLQQRIERERVITQITQQIHRSLSLDEILQTTVTEVRQLLQTDRVLVLRLQPDGNGTVVAESVGADWRSLRSNPLPDLCLAANHLCLSQPESIAHDPTVAEAAVQRYRQGQVTAIADIQDGSIDPYHVAWLASLQVQAKLVVPILHDDHLYDDHLHDDQLWGVLIAHHCVATRSWQPLEIDLLKVLATQVSIALRQAELYEQAQDELTERRRVEIELRESEERLRVALIASRMGTWDWNIQTGKITWSDNLEALFGLAPGAFDGSYEMFVARLHPDDRDRVQAAIQYAITTGEDYNIEFRVVYPNGYIRWAQSQGKVFYDQDGQPLRMAGNDIDITERKRSEASLRESEERFRQLAENIDAVFWLRDVPGSHISYVSPAYERLWGWQPQELHENQQAWVDHIHPDDRAWSARAFEEKAAAGQFDEEYRIVLADGSIRWVHDRCFPLRDEAGKIYRFAGIAEDITERKRSEEALRTSEERFRTSVENMLDCFAIYSAVRNEKGIIVDFQAEYVNDAVCLSSQMTREQHLGHTLCELLPTHRTSGLFDEYCQVVETGQSLVKDSLIYEDAFGEQRLTKAFDIRVAKFGDGYIATWRDITDRKATEAALQNSREIIQQQLEAIESIYTLAPVGLCFVDTDLRFVRMNEHLAQINGHTVSEHIGRSLREMIPDMADEVEPLYRQVIESREPIINLEAHGMNCAQPGVERDWIISLYPQLGADDRVMGVNVVVQEITDRKQAEKALRSSEERYRTLFESMEDGFCVIEMLFDANKPIDYRFLEINPAFEQQTGLEQAVGKTARQLLPTLEDHWFETYGRVALSGKPVRFENGSEALNRWFDVYAFRVGEPGNHKVAILFKDISDRKRAEEEREKLLAQEQLARTEAERANRIKDEFLAVLSHELRSPLNPILGWTKLLQTRSFDENQTAQALATIERNARLQTQLIDDLLDMAKVLRGKLSLTMMPVNLVFVIESAIDTVRAAAVAKAILLHPVLPAIGQVSGDATRLQQIVWNLLSNAIKFTPQGGRVDLRLERVHNQAHIIVSDTGKGIDPDFLPHIFESFRQEDVSVTRKYGGLGLGLAIVRSLVEAHGGTITASSPGEGLGATFTLQLPLLPTQPDLKQSEPSLEQEANLMGIRVLAVDDEPDARELLTVLLSQYGATVLTVATAAEVLAALESFQPNVLISDIGMPEVDGYTLMQQIRALPAENGGQIPAIALTAYAGEVDQQRAATVGFARHLTKPIEPNQLAHAVAAMLRTSFG